MSKNDGGPAFPVADLVGAGLRSIDVNPTTGAPSGAGMSLRDYFAAKAMHAELLSAGSYAGPAKALAEAARKAGHTIEQHIAFNAYELADAMLTERAKEWT